MPLQRSNGASNMQVDSDVNPKPHANVMNPYYGTAKSLQDASEIVPTPPTCSQPMQLEANVLNNSKPMMEKFIPPLVTFHFSLTVRRILHLPPNLL